MLVKCAVCKCSFEQKHVKFFKFPLSKRDLRSAACDVQLNANSKICMYHFKNEDYIELHQASKRARLMPITATLGLVVHAAADGVALGAAATTSHKDVEMIVFLAIMLHKAPAAFGLVSFLLQKEQG